MERLTSDRAVPAHLRGSVVALGNFDGFHRGHQAVAARARELAAAAGRPFVIATFDPHPVRFFKPDAPPFRLTTLDQRARHFAAAGADAMLVFHFDAELAHVSAHAFVSDWLVARAGVSHIVTGQDFTYGAARSGDTISLREQATRLGVTAEAVTAVADPTGPVSSSRIRQALRDGDCVTATALLTRPFAIEAVVQHGDKLGRTIGYPTANMDLRDYLRPAYGIYAVRGRLDDGRVVDGVANLGVRPTFDPPKELLEPFFFNFAEDLYGRALEVDLIRFLRPEAKFDSLEALVVQMARDCEQAKAILAT